MFSPTKKDGLRGRPPSIPISFHHFSLYVCTQYIVKWCFHIIRQVQYNIGKSLLLCHLTAKLLPFRVLSSSLDARQFDRLLFQSCELRCVHLKRFLNASPFVYMRLLRGIDRLSLILFHCLQSCL